MADTRWDKCGTLQRVCILINWYLSLACKVPFGSIFVIKFDKPDVADRKIPLLVDEQIVDMGTLLFGVPFDELEFY